MGLMLSHPCLLTHRPVASGSSRPPSPQPGFSVVLPSEDPRHLVHRCIQPKTILLPINYLYIYDDKINHYHESYLLTSYVGTIV